MITEIVINHQAKEKIVDDGFTWILSQDFVEFFVFYPVLCVSRICRRSIPYQNPIENGHDGLKDCDNHSELSLCCLLPHDADEVLLDAEMLAMKRGLHDL